MKYFLVPIMLASTSFTLASCATASKPEMTPLEIQSIQSRNFAEDKAVVFPSVVSVFQDLGYTIEQADLDTGFITAVSASKGSSTMANILTGTSTSSQTGATAFIEQMGSESRVRLNFVVKKDSSFKYGVSRRRDTAILEPEPYQSAFEKIETAVFVRSSI